MSRAHVEDPAVIPVDPHDCLCGCPDEGAALGLLGLMSGLSEEHWCASWHMGLEYALWRAVAEPDARGLVTQRQAALLRLLSEEAGGWWIWHDALGTGESGPRFLPTDEWLARFRAYEATP